MNAKTKLDIWNIDYIKGEVIKLKNILLECTTCRVWFTPSDERAKYLMKKYGYVGECKECEQDV